LTAALRDELDHVTSRTLADVRLRMHFARGVRLRRFLQVFPSIAHWLPMQPSEREAVARVGELARDTPCYMLAELIVPAQPAGTYRLVSVDASWVDADGRAGKCPTSELVVSFGGENGPLAPEVAYQQDAFQAYSLVERALEARRAQEGPKALTMLKNAQRIVEGRPGHGLAEPLQAAIGALERGLPLSEAQAKILSFTARKPEGGAGLDW
jgi:hypothetical protein